MQKQILLETHRRLVLTLTEKNQKRWRPFPKWIEHAKQYDEILMRYKWFVLEGATRTGKTLWALYVKGNPLKVLYINCANCIHPDMSKFSYFEHEVVVLDEADTKLVIANKTLLQATPQFVQMGSSATNCHSYSVFAAGTIFIICTNNWESELSDWDEANRGFLEDNCTHVNIGKKKMYIEDDDTADDSEVDIL